MRNNVIRQTNLIILFGTVADNLVSEVAVKNVHEVFV